MASSFSWGDTARAAFHSCLSPCFPSSNNSDSEPEYENPHRALTQNADLDGLLASDSEADALSLHSNLGGPRRKRRRPRKNITFFGYNLFGRPPVHLPEDEDAVDDLLRRPRRRNSRASTAHSSSTLDSDAPQLSATSLDALSPEALEARAAQAAQEEEERRAKEERQQKRRHKKEMKRLAAALASSNGSAEFEGFQGSGEDSYRNIPSPFMRSPTQSGSDGYTPRQGSATSYSPHLPSHEDEEDDSADLDGAMYSRPRPRGSSSNGGSDSRSRTSASLSHHSPSNYSNSNPPRSPLSQEIPNAHDAAPRKKKKKSKSSKSSAGSVSTASSSEPQPKSPTLLPAHAEQDESLIHQPQDDFDGTPGFGPDDMPEQVLHDFSGGNLPSAGFVRSGMPSPGLGGPRGKSLQGVNALLGSGF